MFVAHIFTFEFNNNFLKFLKWPYCDGSHVAHNTVTGDNVGPLIVKKKGA